MFGVRRTIFAVQRRYIHRRGYHFVHDSRDYECSGGLWCFTLAALGAFYFSHKRKKRAITNAQRIREATKERKRRLQSATECEENQHDFIHNWPGMF